MIFALSTAHKIGLAGTGFIFIVYSITSAFLIPAYRPNFPGKHVFAYCAVSVLMFLWMMGAVVVFGREQAKAEAVIEKVPTTTTTTTGSSTPSTGDATAGKAVFTANGCGACHTFTPAGSNGTIGPNLDNLADYAAKAGEPIDSFTRAAITTPPASYVPPGYADVMPKTFGTTIKPKDLDDLVAFLTQPQ
jgi:cytochrome c2